MRHLTRCRECGHVIPGIPFRFGACVAVVCQRCVSARGARLDGDELEAAHIAVNAPIADYGRAAMARAAKKKTAATATGKKRGRGRREGA